MKDEYIKKIDFVFYNEKNIRQAVFEARESRRRPELKNGSGLSDPTARDAIRNLTPLSFIKIAGEMLKFPESWLKVIDKTYSWCKRQSACHYEVLRRKYNNEHYKKICVDLHISPTTFQGLINRARQYAALQAAQFRLIYVD